MLNQTPFTGKMYKDANTKEHCASLKLSDEAEVFVCLHGLAGGSRERPTSLISLGC